MQVIPVQASHLPLSETCAISAVPVYKHFVWPLSPHSIPFYQNSRYQAAGLVGRNKLCIQRRKNVCFNVDGSLILNPCRHLKTCPASWPGALRGIHTLLCHGLSYKVPGLRTTASICSWWQYRKVEEASFTGKPEFISPASSLLLSILCTISDFLTAPRVTASQKEARREEGQDKGQRMFHIFCHSEVVGL